MGEKIYLISYEYFPFSHNGLARHAKEVIDRAILEENIYAIVAQEKELEKKNNSKIEFIKIKSRNKFLKYVEFTIKTNMYMFKNKIKGSYVYFSIFSCFLNFLIIFKRNFYIFVHNSMRSVYETNYPFESFKDLFKRKIIYLLLSFHEMFLCVLSKKIFVVSPSSRKNLNKQYRVERKKIVIISNGASLKTIREKGKKKRKKLLYVGRLVPRKNILELIIILHKIVKKDPNFSLSIVGNGEEKYITKIRKLLKELDLEKNVMLHGKVNDAKMVEIYKKSDLFLITSLVEGFGLVILEAMSQGLPVIGYNISGINDIIENNMNGLLIKKGHLENFANKVIRVFQDDELYKKLQENALRTPQRYSWDSSVDKFLSQLNSRKN